MNLFELFFIAIGLSVDAFAISLCLGLTMSKIVAFDHRIGFVLLGLIGGKMIVESSKQLYNGNRQHMTNCESEG